MKQVLKLFDTYEREVRELKPLKGNEIGLYACGPTVYNFVHIGNLRTYIFEDLLHRTISHAGFNVRHVINITDVGHLASDADSGEDKMEVGSRRTGMTAWEIAEFYTSAFKDDLVKLNILEPTIWCKATDHIEDQIAFIVDLESKGFVYETSDGIYFDSRKLDDYGYLARLDIDGLQAGARVNLGEKRFVTDFALWKFSKPDENRQMEWDSPWGIGFPGWHIECSAMSARYLGDYFDIHCGGKDHIPIHHTNEIAQTQASKGTRLANFWLHGYFLQMEDSKMSKSSGDFLRLETLIERGYLPLVFRYFCLQAHYRSELSFSWESLKAAHTSLMRLYEAAYSWGAPSNISEEYYVRFVQHLYNDLNLPRALAVAWELVRSPEPDGIKKATLLAFDEIFGLDINAWRPKQVDIPKEVSSLLARREEARKSKDWNAADQVRDEISRLGFSIEDSKDGPIIKPI
ncbi:MAG: cysteine--tRNA ligase [OM182 bacterium]|uniref:Cysteine--tRNA ligase n=1 Tax=OM182 bacterium TaxID=2510334 RepID=A0A520RX02_9GAMM|nr:MAG: cysteine--tRNA ligase [OM182 bacterium]